MDTVTRYTPIELLVFATVPLLLAGSGWMLWVAARPGAGERTAMERIANVLTGACYLLFSAQLAVQWGERPHATPLMLVAIGLGLAGALLRTWGRRRTRPRAVRRA